MIKYLLLALVSSTQLASAGTLILAVDISESIDITEQQLQMQAYATVLAEPSIQGMLSTFDINVIFFGDFAYDMFTGTASETAIFFTSFATPGAVDEFKDSQDYSDLGTCISSAFQLVLDKEPLLSRPIIVDVSGDGTNHCVYGSNTLDDPYALVQELFYKDIIVNTLPIGSEIIAYYDEVITTGFYQPIYGFEDFETALYIKLFTEVANAIYTERQSSYN